MCASIGNLFIHIPLLSNFPPTFVSIDISYNHRYRTRSLIAIHHLLDFNIAQDNL